MLASRPTMPSEALSHHQVLHYAVILYQAQIDRGQGNDRKLGLHLLSSGWNLRNLIQKSDKMPKNGTRPMQLSFFRELPTPPLPSPVRQMALVSELAHGGIMLARILPGQNEWASIASSYSRTSSARHVSCGSVAASADRVGCAAIPSQTMSPRQQRQRSACWRKASA